VYHQGALKLVAVMIAVSILVTVVIRLFALSVRSRLFLLPSLLDSSPSQYGPGYQLDDLGSILQIVQTDSRGLFVNGYRVAFLLRKR
jgi:hypothetical protein